MQIFHGVCYSHIIIIKQEASFEDRSSSLSDSCPDRDVKGAVMWGICQVISVM
jgi:hypothetical protein